MISKSSSHVTFIVKNLVTVEDVLPVDGTWVYKPVPPAGPNERRDVFWLQVLLVIILTYIFGKTLVIRQVIP